MLEGQGIRTHLRGVVKGAELKNGEQQQIEQK